MLKGLIHNLEMARWFGGSWFCGWTMLFVVLLSAAPTGAAPRTLLVGSAFDPATTSVAMGAKRLKLDEAAERTGAKPGDVTPGISSSLPTDFAGIHWPIEPLIGGQSASALVENGAPINPLAHSRAARAPPLG